MREVKTQCWGWVQYIWTGSKSGEVEIYLSTNSPSTAIVKQGWEYISTKHLCNRVQSFEFVIISFPPGFVHCALTAMALVAHLAAIWVKYQIGSDKMKTFWIRCWTLFLKRLPYKGIQPCTLGFFYVRKASKPVGKHATIFSLVKVGFRSIQVLTLQRNWFLLPIWICTHSPNQSGEGRSSGLGPSGSNKVALFWSGGFSNTNVASVGSLFNWNNGFYVLSFKERSQKIKETLVKVLECQCF